MSDETKKNGFLFHVISDTGNGHQIQTTFNLAEGAKAEDMNKVFDEYFAAIKRIEARTRLPAIEAAYLQEKAKHEGMKKALDRLEGAKIEGRRKQADEAQYQHLLAEIDSTEARVSLHKRSLELTAEEADMESSCLIQAVNS